LITVIAGGTGSVKFVRGIASLTKDLAVIVNVGDNICLHGLYICPDIDTITYGLAGILDEDQGWGVRGDSFECLTQLRRLGASSWFRLGDRDLATHLVRTVMIKQGKTLSHVTDFARNRYGISASIIPATDHEVKTVITTSKGEMHLQEFWVRYRGRLRVSGIRFEGSDSSLPTRSAINAIKRSELIIVAPANPVSSIGPTVALRALRKELAKKRDNVVAVSPLIGQKAISGPAAKYMGALGLDISPLGVAQYYRDFVRHFVISADDHSLASRIRSLGIDVLETNIMMKNRRDEVRLARRLISEFGTK